MILNSGSTISAQCCHYIETSPVICTADHFFSWFLNNGNTRMKCFNDTVGYEFFRHAQLFFFKVILDILSF